MGYGIRGGASFMAIASTALWSVPTLAQTGPEQDDAADNEPDVIIVTAQKRAQSLNDVGLTVNVVDGQDLIDRGINSTTDLAKAVPGFTVAKNGDGTPIYTLRGISFNALSFGTSPTVSVYVDEAPIPFSVMTQGAILDLQRVEVLKGPQGTLFGQNATGGAINYIAARPTQDFRAGLDATYARFNTVQLNGFLSGGLTDNLSARLSFSGVRADPWQRSVSRDDELGRQRKAAARLLLDWDSGGPVRLSLNLNGWIDKSDTQASQLVELRIASPANADPGLVDVMPTTTGPRDADWDPDTLYRRNNYFGQAVLRGEWDIGPDMTLTSLTNVAAIDLDNKSEVDGTPIQLQNASNDGHIEAFSQELRLSGTAGNGSIHYILGGNFQDDKATQDELFEISRASGFRSVSGIGPLDEAIDSSVQKNTSYALFANADIDLTSQLTLSAGVRRTWVRHSDVNCSRDSGNGQAALIFTIISNSVRSNLGLPLAPPIEPGGCATLDTTFAPIQVDDSFKEKNLSWRFNLNYKLDNRNSVYATASRGFKAGNYPVLPATFVSTLSPVTQERLTAYEAGVKLNPLGRLLSLNAAAYYYDYRDKQLQDNVLDPSFGVLVKYVNVPESTVKGFDLDATLRPVNGLTIKSAVTYADSKIDQYSSIDILGQPVVLDGFPFNIAPKWIYAGDIEYRATLRTGLEAFIGGSMSYNSKTYSDLAQSPQRVIDPFTVFDARLGMKSDKGWQVMAFARNLTNKYYWNYAVGAQDAIVRFSAMPRTYGLTIGYRY